MNGGEILEGVAVSLNIKGGWLRFRPEAIRVVGPRLLQERALPWPRL